MPYTVELTTIGFVVCADGTPLEAETLRVRLAGSGARGPDMEPEVPGVGRAGAYYARHAAICAAQTLAELDAEHEENCPGEQPECQWFAFCDHAATTTRSHPVLGDVPICTRCDDQISALEAA